MDDWEYSCYRNECEEREANDYYINVPDYDEFGHEIPKGYVKREFRQGDLGDRFYVYIGGKYVSEINKWRNNLKE